MSNNNMKSENKLKIKSTYQVKISKNNNVKIMGAFQKAIKSFKHSLHK